MTFLVSECLLYVRWFLGETGKTDGKKADASFRETTQGDEKRTHSRLVTETIATKKESGQTAKRQKKAFGFSAPRHTRRGTFESYTRLKDTRP